MDNLEYKVVTSNTPAFGNPQKLQQVLAEEAQAGWELVELIDSHKIRVARNKSERANDAGRSIDPYRINVGIHPVAYFGLAAVLTIVVIYVIIQVAALSVR